MQDTKKIFCSLKKSNAKKQKKYNNNFRKVVIVKPSDSYPWQPAKCNNVRTSKQLRFVASTETFNENQQALHGINVKD